MTHLLGSYKFGSSGSEEPFSFQFLERNIAGAVARGQDIECVFLVERYE
jgi:hypothetical protein